MKHSIEPCFIELFEGKGFQIVDKCANVNDLEQPESLEDSKRGEISGWSSASRRRMRETLLTLAPPVGWGVYGVTLTVAGSPLSPGDSRQLWDRFRQKFGRLGECSAVWRLELQERGACHWHCIFFTPKKLMELHVALFKSWAALLDKFGPDEYITPAGVLKSVPCRSQHDGFFRRAIDVVDGSQSVGAWLRYLCDHASKSKQLQVCDWAGFRHWGILGRKNLKPVKASESIYLNARQRIAFCRCMARLSCPHIRAACVFGSRLGFENRRGVKGRSVWFSRPETIKRLAQYVKTNV